MIVPWCSWNLKPIDPHTATRFSRDCSFEVWSIAAALIVPVYQAALHSLARLSWNLIGCPIYSSLFHVKSVHKKQRTPTLTYFFPNTYFHDYSYNLSLLFFSSPHLILITRHSYILNIIVEKYFQFNKLHCNYYIFSIQYIFKTHYSINVLFWRWCKIIFVQKILLRPTNQIWHS